MLPCARPPVPLLYRRRSRPCWQGPPHALNCFPPGSCPPTSGGRAQPQAAAPATTAPTAAPPRPTRRPPGARLHQLAAAQGRAGAAAARPGPAPHRPRQPGRAAAGEQGLPDAGAGRGGAPGGWSGAGREGKAYGNWCTRGEEERGRRSSLAACAGATAALAVRACASRARDIAHAVRPRRPCAAPTERVLLHSLAPPLPRPAPPRPRPLHTSRCPPPARPTDRPAARPQVCIDLFFLAQAYCDVASLSVLSTTTCGQVYAYQPWDAAQVGGRAGGRAPAGRPAAPALFPASALPASLSLQDLCPCKILYVHSLRSLVLSPSPAWGGPGGQGMAAGPARCALPRRPRQAAPFAGPLSRADSSRPAAPVRPGCRHLL